jgi:hypothetical protein
MRTVAQNQIFDPNFIEELKQMPQGGQNPPFNQLSWEEILGSVSSIEPKPGVIDKNWLSHQTIKRACCLGAYDRPIDVHVPIPDPVPQIVGDGTKSGNLYKKFNYFVQRVNVPKELCTSPDLSPSGNWTPGSENCDIFYKIYCKNMLKRYMDAIGNDTSKYDADEFNSYQQECSCYGFVDPRLGIPENTPKKCYMKGCSQELGDSNLVYLDPTSQSAKGCEVQVCSAIFNAQNINAGSYININSQIDFGSCGKTGSGTGTTSPNQTSPSDSKCVPVATTSTSLLGNLISRLSITQLIYDMGTLKNSFASGGLYCAVTNHLPLVSISFIAIMFLICCCMSLIVVI